MRHQHQIPGLKPLVMDGVVVDVAQDGLGSKPVRGVICVDELAHLVHQMNAGLFLGRNLALSRTGLKLELELG